MQTRETYISVTLPWTSSDVLTGNTSIIQQRLPADRYFRKIPSLLTSLQIPCFRLSYSSFHRFSLSLSPPLSCILTNAALTDDVISYKALYILQRISVSRLRFCRNLENRKPFTREMKKIIIRMADKIKYKVIKCKNYCNLSWISFSLQSEEIFFQN